MAETTSTIPPFNFSCPECGSTDIAIAATVWVAAAGIDHTTIPAFDGASPARCGGCGHRSVVVTFDPDRRGPDPDLPPVVRDCILAGSHLRGVDDDGYCGSCGHQEGGDCL